MKESRWLSQGTATGISTWRQQSQLDRTRAAKNLLARKSVVTFQNCDQTTPGSNSGDLLNRPERGEIA